MSLSNRPTRPAICVDIDNVISRTDEVIRFLVQTHTESRVRLKYEDIVCFDYWRCRDSTGGQITREEWGRIHEEFLENHLSLVEVWDDAPPALEHLNQTLDVHIATSRGERARSATTAWLREHRIPYAELHCVGAGEKHLIDRGFAAAIEDDREQAYALFSVGVPVYLLARPWNHIGRHSPLKRLGDWAAIAREILGTQPG